MRGRYINTINTHLKYLSSLESYGSLTRKLKKEHEYEDEEEGVIDGLLENITEMKIRDCVPLFSVLWAGLAL